MVQRKVALLRQGRALACSLKPSFDLVPTLPNLEARTSCSRVLMPGRGKGKAVAPGDPGWGRGALGLAPARPTSVPRMTALTPQYQGTHCSPEACQALVGCTLHLELNQEVLGPSFYPGVAEPKFSAHRQVTRGSGGGTLSQGYKAPLWRPRAQGHCAQHQVWAASQQPGPRPLHAFPLMSWPPSLGSPPIPSPFPHPSTDTVPLPPSQA